MTVKHDKYSISMTEEEMKKIDGMADKVGQSRSEYIRRACKHYADYLKNEGILKKMS